MRTSPPAFVAFSQAPLIDGHSSADAQLYSYVGQQLRQVEYLSPLRSKAIDSIPSSLIFLCSFSHIYSFTEVLTGKLTYLTLL